MDQKCKRRDKSPFDCGVVTRALRLLPVFPQYVSIVNLGNPVAEAGEPPHQLEIGPS